MLSAAAAACRRSACQGVSFTLPLAVVVALKRPWPTAAALLSAPRCGRGRDAGAS